MIPIENRLNRYPDDAQKTTAPDEYLDVSVKDHRRIRRASKKVIQYELSISSTLPKRDANMKSKNNKRMLASVLNAFSVGDNVTLETRDDRAFCHEETNTTMHYDLVCP